MSNIPSLLQIKWQCRRGMLELDFLFERFITNHFESLSDADKCLLLKLLSSEDTTLWDWLVEDHPVENQEMRDLVIRIQQG